MYKLRRRTWWIDDGFVVENRNYRCVAVFFVGAAAVFFFIIKTYSRSGYNINAVFANACRKISRNRRRERKPRQASGRTSVYLSPVFVGPTETALSVIRVIRRNWKKYDENGHQNKTQNAMPITSRRALLLHGAAWKLHQFFQKLPSQEHLLEQHSPFVGCCYWECHNIKSQIKNKVR
jgi:hypothetical protein